MVFYKKLLCFATACCMLVGVTFNISAENSEKTLSEIKTVYENYAGLNSVIEQYEKEGLEWSFYDNTDWNNPIIIDNGVERETFEGVVSEQYFSENLYEYLHNAFLNKADTISMSGYNETKEETLAVILQIYQDDLSCRDILLDRTQLSASKDGVMLYIYPAYKFEPKDSVLYMNEEVYNAIVDHQNNYDESTIDLKDYKIKREDISELIRQSEFNNIDKPWYTTSFSTGSLPDYSTGEEYVRNLNLIWGLRALTAETKAYNKQLAVDLNKEVEHILSYLDEDMLDIEKVLFIHEYLMKHCVYQLEEKKYSGVTYILNKQGVCNATTQAFMLLMQRCGIEVNYAISSKEMNHIWNAVKLDGVWYYIDATWDDTGLLGVTHRDWLLVSHEKLYGSHYSWKPTYETDTKYDNAKWRDFGSMSYLEGKWYFIKENILKTYDFKTDEVENIAEISNNNGALAYLNGKFYYSSPTENTIRSINPDGTEDTMFLDLKNERFESKIGGLAEEYGFLIFEVADKSYYMGYKNYRLNIETNTYFEYDYYNTNSTFLYSNFDVDKSGEVSIVDIVYVYKIADGVLNLIKSADINADGFINILDKTLIKREFFKQVENTIDSDL